MNTVVVQAHPLDESFSVALLDAAVAGLAARGIEPVVVRLSDGAALDCSALAHVEHLVMVYPTWWGSTPAMLLGPLVDLLSPWIDGDADPGTSPLGSVERLTIVTSHGSSRFVNMLQGEPGRQLWRRTILAICARRARCEWLALYKIDRPESAARVHFLEHVTERLSA